MRQESSEMLQKSLPTFSCCGQKRLLENQGKKLMHRQFSPDLIGEIYLWGNRLFEVFTTSTGKVVMVKPAREETLDLYLESIDISHAFNLAS